MNDEHTNDERFYSPEPDTHRVEDHPLEIPPAMPWEPLIDEGSSPAEAMMQAIYQAVGSGAMCWEDVKRAGLFNPELAGWVAAGLYAFIADLIDPEGGESR